MQSKQPSGFSLIEMLLVMVIISMVIYMGIGYVQQRTLQLRIDRTSMQMQQIMSAGLSYYVMNGSWPANIGVLRPNYLPATTVNNPWGQAYRIASSAQLLYVVSPITGSATSGQANAAANTIAGTLPLSYTTTSNSNIPATTPACAASSTTCNVVASVNIPGQNLNNASAVNYAGLYHHGGCVPVPTCPVGPNGVTMTPQIMLVPVSVSGVNDAGNQNVYPISSFTAYVTQSSPLDNKPPRCSTNSANSNICYSSSGVQVPASGKYWRACLQVVTSKGDVSSTNSSTWGQYVTMMAITRCSISNEQTGSDFSVFTR